MLGRLGLVGRLLAILLLVILALVALTAGALFASRMRAVDTPPRRPLPEQAAAMVALLEEADATRRAALLRAFNSESLGVTVREVLPQPEPHMRRLPEVEWLMNHELQSAGTREVVATIDVSDDTWLPHWRLGGYYLYTRDPLRIAVALRSGGYVVFETNGNIGFKLFGVPAGFWIGVLGAVVGLAAIWAVMREARPLQALAHSVSRFAGGAEPTPIAPQGAPDVRRLISAVNEMQARIASLLRGRTILIAAISHDLKTFITRLRLRIEQLDDADQRGRATRDIDDMTALIDDALAVARGTTVPERWETVDLNALIAADLADRPEGCMRVRLDAPDSPLTVEGDAVALRRVFGNLVNNAMQFATRAEIALSCERGAIVAYVDDDGPGIGDADRGAVFEPFYRADPSRSRATGGTGLGLAIAKQIVEAHGGTISIDRAPAGGARFEVRLPAKMRAGARDVMYHAS